MRRRAPVVVISIGLAVLLGWYIAYTQRVVGELRREAKRSARMYADVYRGLNSPNDANGIGALLQLADEIRQAGVPLIVTTMDGTPTAAANLPFDAEPTDARVRAYVPTLDATNDPVVVRGVGMVHFGDTPLVRGLQLYPILQGITLAILLAAGVIALRSRGRADRDRVWAGMARESAHQLGTPLSSLRGWLELLEERDVGDGARETALLMRGDVERLERVAHRFERIGRPPRREPVDVGALVTNVAAYFRARVPTLARAVRIETMPIEQPVIIAGDAVLLEWALEALVKNAIDALGGRGGTIRLSAEPLEDGARVRVSDDGPGIPRELRSRIFDAGYTTKKGGWGIGLPLARRIVEEWHGGTLRVVPADGGATFEIIFS
jgi:nitrogen-specific signal transduction histidine kinase